MAKKALKKLPKGMVTVFKIKNRAGFAAICLKNLTEGSTAAQAMDRLKNPLKRMGYELN
jgi:hypothetical protein